MIVVGFLMERNGACGLNIVSEPFVIEILVVWIRYRACRTVGRYFSWRK